MKTIFVLIGRSEPVSTSALAHELAVTAPTVSIVLKRLGNHGLVERTGEHLAVLTAHGTRHAQQIVRRHRLVESFLAKVLDVPWDEVYAEVEVMQHAVSDRLLARMDALLGHSTLDPHGDPIPAPGADHVEALEQWLDRVRPGTRFRIERIYDRDIAALRLLGELGVPPGVTAEVGEREPFGGPPWVSLGDRRHALGQPLACLVHGREER